MKTVTLSDESYAVIAAALEKEGQGLEMVIALLDGRRGPKSGVVRERANLALLTAAAFEFYGWSTWRNNDGRSLPAGSVFEPPGKDG
jgi:hypothetical protein